MELLALTSLIFGTFTGWISGDNKGTLLGRMISFSAFVAISSLYVASVTADVTTDGTVVEAVAPRYFTALWAFSVSYVLTYYLFAKLSERRAKAKSLISWRGDNIQMDLADFVATLATLTHLSEEQLKATTSIVSGIREQVDTFKKASEEKTATSNAKKRAISTELE